MGLKELLDYLARTASTGVDTELPSPEKLAKYHGMTPPSVRRVLGTLLESESITAQPDDPLGLTLQAYAYIPEYGDWESFLSQINQQGAPHKPAEHQNTITQIGTGGRELGFTLSGDPKPGLSEEPDIFKGLKSKGNSW